MKSLLYLTVLNIEDQEKVGILGKIHGQILAMKKRGIDVHFGHFLGLNTFVIEHGSVKKYPAKGNNTRKRLSSIYDRLIEYLGQEGIQYVYIRFTGLDSHAIMFYKKLKEMNIHIIIEFYSHNLELEMKKSIFRAIKEYNLVLAAKSTASYLIDKHYLNKIKNYVDIIVTTTPVDGGMYGIPTINVRNGITPETFTRIDKVDNGYDLTIVSVAMISVWHGYDRVIKGLSNYYKNGGKKRVKYYVIGDGEARQSLEKMTDELGLNENVCFTGVKTGKDLDNYYNQSDLALEMLAGFRRTNGPISSIKMAEYFAKGIPVLYSTNVDFYDQKVLEYCYRIPYDESPVNFEDIFAFIESLKRKKENISDCMHKIAIDEFDWVVTAKELHEYILNN